MKKIQIISIAALLSMAFSCNDDFMERYPLSSLSPETFFGTENELNSYTNAFYNHFPGMYDIIGQTPDDESRISLPGIVQPIRPVPASGGGWSWERLRQINFFLEHSGQCPDKNIRAKYDGLALFFRTYFYFDKIKNFGDVPWYDHVLGSNEEDLYKARDSREMVFNHMLEDINYAIEYLQTGRNSHVVTKWTALALKSRMCLFEGTFRKYHGMSGWEAILKECVSASDNLITNSGYRVYTSTKDKAYFEMFTTNEANAEMILARHYNTARNVSHETTSVTFSPGMGRMGVNRSLINSYLKTDGTRFTDNPAYLTMQWYEEMQDRDPRLSQSVRAPGRKWDWDAKAVPTFDNCVTGYQYVKYIINSNAWGNTVYNALPIFRYAEVLLNFAEAKAELGEITQADIDKSIKPLRDRVEMPNLILADANQNPDPYIAEQYPRVTGANKGVILEIRRERRIELIREGFRTWDVYRWKEGQLFTRAWKGMYFPGVGAYDMDHDGVIDYEIYEGSIPTPQIPGRVYLKLGEFFSFENGAAGGHIIANYGLEKKFDESKDYLLPIPTQDRQLNTNLTQNPGWPLE